METGILLFVILLLVIAIVFSFKSREEIKPGSDEENHIIKKVHHVIDGDTIIVGDIRGRFKIRLYAIDCPEDGQPWGDTAKYGLVRLIGGRHVRIESHGYDQYERMLATIYVQSDSEEEWINVNAKMVVCGHAWVMRRYYNDLSRDRQNDLNSKEYWAKSKQVGLWKTENPIPPWDWRKDSEQN